MNKSLENIKDTFLSSMLPIRKIFKGCMIRNLSIVPNSIQIYGNSHYFSITDESSYRARAIIHSSVYERSIEKGYVLDYENSIDIKVSDVRVDKWLQLQIAISFFVNSGLSETEALRKKITKYIDELNYSTRKKKDLPLIIKSIAILTTTGSSIESDIMNQTGLKKELIESHRFNTTAIDLSEKIQTLDQQNKYDVIVLYRGGREDGGMFVFSDPLVLDVIHSSYTPVATALGHEADQPPVQLVADKSFDTPTKFATFVREKNDVIYNDIIQTMESITTAKKLLIEKIHEGKRNAATKIKIILFFLIVIGCISGVVFIYPNQTLSLIENFKRVFLHKY